MSTTTQRAGRASKAQETEEFFERLNRGGELLSAGKIIEAKEHLEVAHQLAPKNEKGQNLLGLAYFKLGLFDRAAEIYEMLVRENPVDPTLRVNLGLVYLKTQALQRAVREFETATDLAPDHKKAHNYLGLALAQAGEYGRAKEHFQLAGSEVMVEKMARAIEDGEGVSAPPPPPRSLEELPSDAAEVTVSAAANEESFDVMEDESGPSAPTPAGEDWGAQFGLEAPPPAAHDEDLRFAEDEGPSAIVEEIPGAQDEGAPAEFPAEDLEPQPEELTDKSAGDAFSETERHIEAAPLQLSYETSRAAMRQERTAPLLADLAPEVSLVAATESTRFEAGHGCFSIAVNGELLTRLDGLLALTGSLNFFPETKRFRGQATDKAFGEGAAQVMRASGQGVLFVESGVRTFLAVELGDASAYFRDECVFAFEESIVFENGRLPSEAGSDLDLVHLRGQGRVLLSLPGSLRTIPVRLQEPVTIPLSHLVGWQGAIGPQMVSLSVPGGLPTQSVGVELSGEGFALIALSPR